MDFDAPPENDAYRMQVRAWIEENPNPTEEEVRYGIAGNLCRCTGYQNIIKAVMDAASEMRGS